MRPITKTAIVKDGIITVKVPVEFEDRQVEITISVIEQKSSVVKEPVKEAIAAKYDKPAQRKPIKRQPTVREIVNKLGYAIIAPYNSEISRINDMVEKTKPSKDRL